MPFRMLWWAVAWQAALCDKPAWHAWLAGTLTYFVVFWSEIVAPRAQSLKDEK